MSLRLFVGGVPHFRVRRCGILALHPHVLCLALGFALLLPGWAWPLSMLVSWEAVPHSRVAVSWAHSSQQLLLWHCDVGSLLVPLRH